MKTSLTVIAAILALILGAFAESPADAGLLKNGVKPGDRSKMHIIKRPARGTRKRIFAPGERQRLQQRKKRTTGGGKRRRGQQYAWFWRTHNPGMTAASTARWGEALATMTTRRAEGFSATGTGTVQRIARTFEREIRQAANRHGLSEALLVAVIAVESRGNPGAVSPKNAQGLMQLIPATARRFGVSNPFDSAQNIDGGAAYLNWLLREFRGDPLLALAGYNAGEGAVRKHRGVPPYAETRDYVVKVMDAAVAAQKLCGVPLTGPRVRCTPSGS